MAADSFDRSVEQQVKRHKTVHDFRDFKDVINSANGVAVTMGVSYFRNYSSKLISKASGTHYPRLDKVVVAEFRKGSSFYIGKKI